MRSTRRSETANKLAEIEAISEQHATRNKLVWLLCVRWWWLWIVFMAASVGAGWAGLLNEDQLFICLFAVAASLFVWPKS